MEVMEGYKQTEVGIIPKDWCFRSLGEVVIFLDGKRRPVKDTDRAKRRGSIPYYGASGIVDYINDYIFDEELILLGEDGENIISRNLPLAFRISGKVWVNNHAHVLRPKPDINIVFLTNYLESLNYERFNSGTAQPKLNKQICFRIPVVLPATFAEQEAIAEALSDADALIESLEQLISKKRQIKQAAMRELFRSQKYWISTNFGAIARQIIGGGTPNRTISEYWNGNIPWMTVKDFSNHSSTETIEYITQKGLKNSASNLIPKRTIIISTRMGLGKAVIFDIEVAINQDLKAIITSNDVDTMFLFYWFQFNSLRIAGLGSGSTVMGLSLADLRKIQFLKPPHAEQVAIAKILSDLDDDITILETKLKKIHQIKQGMMHNLLTGRIRLI